MNLTNPSTLCLFLLAVIIVLLWSRTRARLAGQQQRSKQDNEPSVPREKPDELARWEVEMHETARRLCGQLDAKLGLLQALVAEADRAAQRLEAALERAGPALPPADESEPVAATEQSATGLDLTTVEPPLASGSGRSARRDEIYQLADYGFAPAEIARRVGSPVGEVELVLSLRAK